MVVEWLQRFCVGNINWLDIRHSIDPAKRAAQLQAVAEFEAWCVHAPPMPSPTFCVDSAARRPAEVTLPLHQHPLHKSGTVYTGAYGCDVCKVCGRSGRR